MSLADAARGARRKGHARGSAPIRRSARSVSCRLRGHMASGRTRRRPAGRAFHCCLNGPFGAVREGPAGSAATGDAGLSPGTSGARVGQPDGASNCARRAGRTRDGAARRIAALQELLNGSTSVPSGPDLWVGARVGGRLPQKRPGRGDGVRDRLPRGAARRRGDVRDVSHEGGSDRTLGRAPERPPGPGSSSRAPCGRDDRVGRGHGHRATESCGERRARGSGRA
jgi:hypothetical protein